MYKVMKYNYKQSKSNWSCLICNNSETNKHLWEFPSNKWKELGSV